MVKYMKPMEKNTTIESKDLKKKEAIAIISQKEENAK